MRLARIVGPDGVPYLARLDGGVATPIAISGFRPGEDPLRDAMFDEVDLNASPQVAPEFSVKGMRFLPPMAAPSKIIAIGLNYADHARESGMEIPASPLLFMKAPSGLVGHDEPIRFRAAATSRVDFEAELAVVVGRRAYMVNEDEAFAHVFGYTVCNDVSARDAQFADGQWVRGKSFDTFCPLGPSIVTREEIPDPHNLAIGARLNGRVMQDSNTREMVAGVPKLLSYISQFMTLEPGDIIATGTPFGVGFSRTPPVYLTDGDVVEVEVEQVGILRNPVVVE
ncbi:MAG: fumarylacetoacetate hydrolase family protein [Actinomycetota bacterium]